MFERYGDIWAAAKKDKPDAIIITTNGFVKKNGEAVMGRGIALEAKNYYPKLPLWLGIHLRQNGNIGWAVELPEWWLITLPVKPQFGPSGEPGWRAKANVDLIRNSVIDMERYLLTNINASDTTKKVNTVYMPRPGCGNGGLKWETVKPIIEPYLDDRFVVFHKEI